MIDEEELKKITEELSLMVDRLNTLLSGNSEAIEEPTEALPETPAKKDKVGLMLTALKRK